MMPGGRKLSKYESNECQKEPGKLDTFRNRVYDMKGCYLELAEAVRDHKAKILGLSITSLLFMVRYKYLI